jgi:hypothetical protein
MPRCSTDVTEGAVPVGRSSDPPELATGRAFLVGKICADKVRMKPVWDLTTPYGGRGRSRAAGASAFFCRVALRLAARIAQRAEDSAVESASPGNVRFTERPAVKAA